MSGGQASEASSAAPHSSRYLLSHHPPTPPPSVENLSSTKMVPGAKKVGDCWVKMPSAKGQLTPQERDGSALLFLPLLVTPRPESPPEEPCALHSLGHPSALATPGTDMRWQGGALCSQANPTAAGRGWLAVEPGLLSF